MFASLESHEPSNPLPHLYLLGCAISAHRPAAVGSERQALHRLVPKGSAAYGMAGAWLASGGYCAEAQEEFAVAEPPGAAGAFEFALAQCHQDRGEIGKALEEYRKALDLNPDKEEYSLSLSILLAATGDTENAGKALVDAVKRHPRSVRILVAMGLLHLELGYPDRARIGYEKARAIDPESPMVWKLLGRIQNAEGHYEDAVKSFEHAAARDNKDAQIPLFMGMALARIEGRADQALAAFLHAQELDPSLTEACFQAATIYFQAKEDYASAAALLEKVIAATPGHTRARQLLIQAYYRLGWKEKAIAEEQKLRELSEGGKP
jgi:tetratricopeptide (TPR) repeat protein